jgi:nickel superoxide dismutase
MIRQMFLISFFLCLISLNGLAAHCQLPCGIYHDDMAYDQIDQYIETMYKGITVINDSQFKTPRERNETIRWVMLKDKESDKMAHLITSYFLQQKISLNDPDLTKKLTAAHKLLFLLVTIKQNTDRNIVKDFAAEWDKFKLMFHVEGYECEIQKLKKKRWDEARKHALEHSHDHQHEGDEHDHADHDHHHEES